MKFTISIILALVLYSSASVAQEEVEEVPDTQAYATYFYCDTSKEEAADEFVNTHLKPVYDAAVEAGTISSWLWLSHNMGGKWRRLLVRMAPGMPALLAGTDKIEAAMDKALEGVTDTLGETCNAHDDYIWEFGQGGGEPGGEVSFSVYHTCSYDGEERADEIMETVMAPVFNANIGEGKLTNWGWASHVVGGKFRRLQTMSAANMEDLMRTRGEILGALYGDDGPEEAKEFSKACPSHIDYVWNLN